VPYSTPVRWNCQVEAFGRKVQPGQLIHADRHGFLLIPKEDETGLLEAARFMDSNECQTMISAARSATGMSVEDILKRLMTSVMRLDETQRKNSVVTENEITP